jgi:hypothetical protein
MLFRWSMAVLGLAAAGQIIGPQSTPAPCWFDKETYPERPFVLKVSVDRSAVRIGESVQVTYLLTNQSESAVGACALGWGNFRVVGAAGKHDGITTVSDGVAAQDVIRIPAHSSLSWVREVAVPDVGPGRAQIIGEFVAHGWLWKGQVLSQPVFLDLLPAEDRVEGPLSNTRLHPAAAEAAAPRPRVNRSR